MADKLSDHHFTIDRRAIFFMNSTLTTQKSTLEKAVKAAVIIGDQLLATGIDSPYGLTWQVFQNRSSSELQWDNPENIDTGVAGIVLYLLELFKVTNDGRYLAGAQRGLQWLVHHCESTPSDNYALYTGRAGVAFALLEMRKVTGTVEYLQTALALMSRAKTCFLTAEYITSNLFDGLAGTLLVLLHLYDATGNREVLDDINLFADKIVQNAYPSYPGICWRTAAESHVQPLCSLAGGTAGIQFVFAELGRYFGSKACRYVDDQAYRYENSVWDADLSNWPDFRKEIIDAATDRRHRQAYFNQDKAFFTRPADNISWAHGTAGIGLMRLRSFQCEKGSARGADLAKALDKLSKTVFTISGNNSLYDGLAGQGIAFIQAYKITGKKELQSAALQVGEWLLVNEVVSSTSLHMDNSLLRGAPGIGYFYLQLLEGQSGNTCLLPIVDKTVSYGFMKDITFDVNVVRRSIIAKPFRRTLAVLESRFPGRAEQLFCSPGVDEELIEAFAALINVVLGESDGNINSEHLRDVFTFEEKKQSLLKNMQSTAWQQAKGMCYYDQVLKQLNKSDVWLLDQQVFISNEVTLVSTSWDWSTDSDPLATLDEPKGQFNTLFYYVFGEGLIELPLHIIGLFMHYFAKPKSISDAIKEIALFCRSQSESALEGMLSFTRSKDIPELLSRLDYLLLFQIKQLLSDGILVFSGSDNMPAG